MNEFTIEELKYLRCCVVSDIDKQDYLINSEHNITASKIQSMIDNYCDHQYILTLYDYKVYCEKCGKGLNDYK